MESLSVLEMAVSGAVQIWERQILAVTPGVYMYLESPVLDRLQLLLSDAELT